MRFLVHFLIPNVQYSGGMRALARFGDVVRPYGHEVIYPTTQGGVCQFVDDETIIHVCPEIMQEPSLPHRDRIVRWLLGPRIYPQHPTDLEFCWNAHYFPGMQELRVDVIEPELFYPKSRPGKGILYFRGKGDLTNWTLLETMAIPYREIDKRWPIQRSDVARWLRDSELLITDDPYTALTLESTICGTPVISPMHIPNNFGHYYGVVPSFSHLAEARSTVHLAARDYERTREIIKADIPAFLARCEQRFG